MKLNIYSFMTCGYCMMSYAIIVDCIGEIWGGGGGKIFILCMHVYRISLSLVFGINFKLALRKKFEITFELITYQQHLNNQLDSS